MNAPAALPSVSEVLTRLQEGTCSQEQAEGLISDHMRLVENVDAPTVTVHIPALDRLVDLIAAWV